MESYRAPPKDEPSPPLCLECLHPAHLRACAECGRRCALVRAGRIATTLAGFASFIGLLVLFFALRRARERPSMELCLAVGVPLAIVALTVIVLEVRRRTR